MSAGEPVAAPAGPLLKTPLYGSHVARGAHLVPFHGWSMPLYYASTGILAEHQAVREDVGVFDVSHMGILSLEGSGGASLLSRRTPSDPRRGKPGQVRYTCLLDADGRMIDDALWARTDAADEPTNFLFVPNAGTAPRIFELLRQHRPSGCSIALHNGRAGILAVQGPRSRALLEELFGWKLDALRFYTGAFFALDPGASGISELGGELSRRLASHAWVSRTGYTGEFGYEILLAAERMRGVFDRLLERGAVPCGLGARDTLRMEMGYLLSGVDFDRDRSPLEGGLERFLEWDHAFVGKEALEAQRRQEGYARWTGLLTDEPGVIPRHGQPLRAGGQEVSLVSSGGLSPTLRKGIALAYLPPAYRKEGTELTLALRGREARMRVTPLPFVRPKPPVARPGPATPLAPT